MNSLLLNRAVFMFAHITHSYRNKIVVNKKDTQTRMSSKMFLLFVISERFFGTVTPIIRDIGTLGIWGYRDISYTITD